MDETGKQMCVHNSCISENNRGIQMCMQIKTCYFSWMYKAEYLLIVHSSTFKNTKWIIFLKKVRLANRDSTFFINLPSIVNYLIP